ncbi:MAG: hypothetical protein ABWY64_04565 [Tardiphaga sp.]|jgi:hypothetical protein
MSLAYGLMMLVTGLAIMTFGLFLFYAWLPLIYALIGFDIGLLLGRSLTGDTGTIAIAIGITGAVLLGVCSYALEPYRRILLGVSGGFLFGLSLAAAFGLDSLLGGFFGVLLAIVCGLIGGVIVSLFFDRFVIAASAISGAAIAMAGAHHLLPGVGIFDRASGGALPALITLVLAVAGVFWQYSNLAKWIQVLPLDRSASNTSANS